MSIQPFKLERYFARYEFSVKYLLSSSDCESLDLDELLGMSAPESRDLWSSLKLWATPNLRAEATKLYERITAENVLIAAPEEAIFVTSSGGSLCSQAPALQRCACIHARLGGSRTEHPLLMSGCFLSLSQEQR
jgi:hypothetical protein